MSKMNLLQELKICKLIEKMEKEYGLYIGTKSLPALFHFLGGYCLCVYEMEHYLLRFRGEFQRYIAERYRNYSESWLDIIVSHSQEKSAFDSFFGLYRKFLNETEYGKQLLKAPTRDS